MNSVIPVRITFRTTFCGSFRSPQIVLIPLPSVKCSRLIFGIVSTISIPRSAADSYRKHNGPNPRSVGSVLDADHLRSGVLITSRSTAGTTKAAGAAITARTLAALGSLISVGGSLMAGLQRAAAARTQAAALERQAADEATLSAAQNRRERQQFRGAMARQRAELAARGVAADSVTAIALGQQAVQGPSFQSQARHHEAQAQARGRGQALRQFRRPPCIGASRCGGVAGGNCGATGLRPNSPAIHSRPGSSGRRGERSG